MEDRLGWDKQPYNAAAISFDNTNAHTGNNSLKINTTGTGYAVSNVQSNKVIRIDNKTDTEYTFTGWVKSDSPTAQLTLFEYKENETTYTKVESVSTTTVGQWIPITKTVMVAANIKYLNLRVDNVGTGTVWFDDVQIRKTSNTATAVRNLNIDYNVYKSPTKITETGVDIINFAYNDSNSRSAMFYGSLDALAKDRPYRKFYSADGTMEIKENGVTGIMEFVTYIGGDGYSAPIVLKSDATTQNYLYLHRDYQGSIVAITNASGDVVEKRLFDAWGSIVKVQDGAGNTLAGLTVLDRGYTGHEHLQSVGLINMNARLYDPKLHRFLQPDNYVQDPSNTQSYNRYAYCVNNPLKYADINGEFFWIPIIIGAVIGGVGNWIAHGAQLNMEGLKAFGIGAGAGALAGIVGPAAFAAVGGGAAGAGGFIAGAASAGLGASLSQAVLSVGNNIAFGDPLMSGKDMITGIAFAALLGGTINGVIALNNGNTFWRGTPPRIAPQPISLPKPAGLVKNGETPQIKSDVKIANTTQTSTAPTASNNTASVINKETGYVKLDPKEFGIKNYPPNNGAVKGTENLEYLQKGVLIDRYGSLNGTYASPAGTPLELRALPPSNSGILNSFEVIKPFPVQSSTIAPWYNQLGGGIQYKLPKNINWLLENGFIK